MPQLPHLENRRGNSSAHPWALAHGGPRCEAMSAERKATGKAQEKPARVAVCIRPAAA